jgi:hypothetical protein
LSAGWRRWRAPLLVTTALLSALAAGRLLRGEAAPSARCQGGAAEIAREWSASRRAALERLLRAAPDLPDGPRATALDGLDRYGAAWAAMHREACLAHRDGAQSDEKLDQRMACLAQRKTALAAAVRALNGAPGAALSEAGTLVSYLPAIEDCSEPERLDEGREPPSPPADRARRTALEEKLAAAVAQERLGQSEAALDALRALALELRGSGLDAPRLATALHLALGRVYIVARHEYANAIPPLRLAEELSATTGASASFVEAGARRLYAEAMLRQSAPAVLLAEGELLEKMSRQLRDGFARPLLLNNLGAVHMTMADRERAHERFRAAAAALGERPVPPELYAIKRNLAMLTRDDATRLELAREVLEQRRRVVGDAHPLTIEAQLTLGKYEADLGSALPRVEKACADYDRYQPRALTLRARCGLYLAMLRGELGDAPGALAQYEAVAALAAAPAALPNGPRSSLPLLFGLARGAASLGRGLRAEARAELTALLATATATTAAGDDWWSRYLVATARLGVAMTSSTDAASRRAALEYLTLAIPVLREVRALNEDREYQLRLMQACRELARLVGDPAARAGYGCDT